LQPGEDALRKALDRMLTEAAARVSASKPMDASRSYARAAQFAEQVAELCADGGESEAMRMRAVEYRSRSLAMAKGRLDSKRCRPNENTDAEDLAYSDADSDALEQQILMLIEDGRRAVEWDRIGGLDDLGRELKFHYGLALAKRPEGVEIEGWNNVMLYGPPGNGKTLLAGAIAHNLGATFFNVKASQIVSKWVGESGRLIASLYRLARKFSLEGPPSIIFIDEFDALCQERGHDTQLHHRQMLASILSELDGFAHKGRASGGKSGGGSSGTGKSDGGDGGDGMRRESRVLTLCATNRPWDLDAAALSRFERRMFIPLPDAAARESIFRIHLARKGIPVAGGDSLYALLAAHSQRLSGREIARVCKEAVARMLAETNAGIPALVDGGAENLRAYTLKLRLLTAEDFLPLLENLLPDTGEAEAERYRHWGVHA
jgi:katanin p60 ATPase-containing subunit A1